MKEHINETAEVSRYIVAGNKVFPNNLDLPVLTYKCVLNLPDTGVDTFIKNIFSENDWKNSWTNGIANYHHYHSNTHEVLGVSQGKCMVILGGDDGILVNLEKGDIIVLPAGVAHKNVGCSGDFECVGAYPGGVDFDMNFGKPEERPATDENIRKVSLPKRDPVLGKEGPIHEHWKQDESKKVIETTAQF